MSFLVGIRATSEGVGSMRRGGGNAGLESAEWYVRRDFGRGKVAATGIWQAW